MTSNNSIDYETILLLAAPQILFYIEYSKILVNAIAFSTY